MVEDMELTVKVTVKNTRGGKVPGKKKLVHCEQPQIKKLHNYIKHKIEMIMNKKKRKEVEMRTKVYEFNCNFSLNF